MRKVLLSFLGVVIVLAGAALAAPSFIDWNAYKGQIAEAAREATGRQLAIDGDISAALLPAPALSVANARLGNAQGAKAPDMVAFKSLSVRVALWPLLKGEIQVQGVTLVDPVIELERLADGSGNWEFRPAAAKPAPSASTPAPGGARAAVRIDRVEIRNGRVVYRDVKAGTFEAIERLNADIRADSLSGPFIGRADFAARGAPLAVEFNIGDISRAPVALTLALDVAGGKAKTGFTGTLLGLGPDAKIAGKIKSESGNLAAALAPFGVTPMPLLARQLVLEAEVQGSPAQAAVKDLRVALGHITVSGAVNASFGERPRIEAALNVGQINLDQLLASTGTPAAAPAASQAKPAGPNAAGAGFALPPNVTAKLDVTLAALTYNERTAQQGKLQATLANGVLTIDRLGALLPGNTDARVSGRLAAERGEPQFTGRVDLASDNARALLAWLNVDAAGIPANRLRQLRLGAAARYGDRSAALSSIELKLDDTRITGSLSYAMGAKPSFGADIAIDAFNIDAYLPQAAPAPAAAKAPAGASPAPRQATGGGSIPDGDVRLKLAQLTFQGRPIKGIEADGQLRSGALELKRAAIGDFGGISAAAAGRIEGLAAAPRVDLRLSGEGKDLAQIARGFGVDYRPAAVNLGGFRLAVAIKGDASAVQFAGLKGNIGPANFEGDGSLRLDKGRPHLTAKLAASEILVDLFLPAAAQAAAAPRPGTTGGARAAAPLERWTRDKIDLGYLHALDADISLAARGIQFSDYSFKEPQLALALANGALEVKKLSGRLFGGAVDLKARIAAGDVNSAWVEVSLAGADLKQALVTALQMDRVAGRFGMSGRFETRGNSQYDMVRALNGRAAIEAGEGMVTGMDLKRLSDRLKRLDQVTDVLDLVGGAMSGGQTKLLSAKGTWTAERGVFRSNDTLAALDGAEAVVNGSIDLPNWQLDVASRMRLSEHPNAPAVGVDLRGPIDQPVRDVKSRELEAYVAERVGGSVLRRVLKDRVPGAAQPAPGAPADQPAAKPAKPAEQILRGILKGLPQR